MVLLESRFTLSVVTSSYFVSLYLYISSFLVCFLFFFVLVFTCFHLFFPFKTREASWSLVGLFPSRSELQLPVSPTHVFFRRCCQKCVSGLWGDPRSGQGGGVTTAAMRRNANTQISVWLRRPRENQRSTRQISSGLGYFEKRMQPACSHYTPELGVCVCVSS